MGIKELNINGKVYAMYKIRGNFLFLKMIIQIVPGDGNEIKSEDLLIHIIQLIENVKLHSVGYLKI